MILVFLNFNPNFKFGFYNPSPDSLRFLNKQLNGKKLKMVIFISLILNLII